MENIPNLLKIHGVDSERIKDLMDLNTFTSNDMEELEGLLNSFSKCISFLKLFMRGTVFEDVNSETHSYWEERWEILETDNENEFILKNFFK